jgi:thioredoxin reductase
LNAPTFFFETTVPGSLAAGGLRRGSAKRYATAVKDDGMVVEFTNHILENET